MACIEGQMISGPLLSEEQVFRVFTFMSPSNLAVFDFDWSLIDQDSDDWVASHFLKQPITDVFTAEGTGMSWLNFVNQTIDKILDQGVTREQMAVVLADIPFSKSMKRVLHLLHANGTRVVILSDANTFFIDTILRAHGVRNLVTDIITNIAHTDSQYLLHIEPCIPTTEPPHNCQNQCPANLCKGRELERYVAEYGPFNKIMYVGDGKNDYCPIQRLRPTDRAFVRMGRTLESLVVNHPDTVAAEVTYWKISDQVLEAVQFERL